MTPRVAIAVMAFFGLITTPLLAQADTQGHTECAIKQNAISTQIEQARSAGNLPQLAGLEKALKQAKANCTEAGLKKQRLEKTAKAQKEVSQRKADLASAMQSGDVEKINKRKQKLEQSQQELQAELAKNRPD